MMTPENFKEYFIEAKSKAHQLKFGDGGFSIRRGMGHVISGWVEDAFSLYVANKINNPNFEYFVDKVVSYREAGLPKTKSFKPDVLSIDNITMTAEHIFDLKTDLGYNRNDFDNFINSKRDFIKGIRGKSVWTTISDGKKKEKKEFKISDSIFYTIIVVIDWNIDQETLRRYENLANLTDEVRMLTLLNHYPEEDDSIKVNDLSFGVLEEIILPKVRNKEN